MKDLYRKLHKAYYFIYNLFYSIFCLHNIRIFLNNHITVGLKYVKKRKTKFPHPIGIVIGQKVVLGDNCIIYQNVTIGSKNTANYKNSKYPVLGDNVTIYPNSIIIGDVKIGNNAIIGAGSLVLDDVEEDSIVAGTPAKKIEKK